VRASVKAPFAKPVAASSPLSAAAAVAAAALPTCSPFDVRVRAAKLERDYLLALKMRAAMGAGAALQDALQRLRAAGAPQHATNMRAHDLRTRRRMHNIACSGWRTQRRGVSAATAAEAAAAAGAKRAAAEVTTRVLAAQARAQLERGRMTNTQWHWRRRRGRRTLCSHSASGQRLAQRHAALRAGAQHVGAQVAALTYDVGGVVARVFAAGVCLGWLLRVGQLDLYLT
jgi:hypothetical protein